MLPLLSCYKELTISNINENLPIPCHISFCNRSFTLGMIYTNRDWCRNTFAYSTPEDLLVFKIPMNPRISD